MLRRSLRARRDALDAKTRRAAADVIARSVDSLGLLGAGRRVGIYLPLGGEVDTRPILDLARRRDCRVYAPVITSFLRRSLRFAPLRPNRVHTNRWGILEPDRRDTIHGRWLDVVITPCVAFDAGGARLGLGAGFYDRHFAFLRWRVHWRRPLLVGVAYECQRVEALAQAPWDVPLTAVVTERHIYWPTPSA